MARFIRPVCSGDMYGSEPSISRAGRAVVCSRAMREAMPKSAIFTSPVSWLKRMLCGLRSLWISPRPWISATTRGDAHRQRQEGADRHRLAREPIERVAVKVLQLEGGQALKARERERLDDRQALERPAELVLVPQPVHVSRTACASDRAP